MRSTLQYQENKRQSSKELLQISMASAQCQKPATTTVEICQPKSQHTSLGQKISEMTNKALKGHHARHGSTNLAQPHTSSKTETHCYSQTQTHKDKDHGVAKTEITLTVVQAHITQTQTNANCAPPPPYHAARGTTTTCFGTHNRKHRDHNNGNNTKDRNLFRRIKGGISRHGSDSDGSSDSDSDNEKCRTKKASSLTQIFHIICIFVIIKLINWFWFF